MATVAEGEMYPHSVFAGLGNGPRAHGVESAAMALQLGARLGPYDVLEKLGEGGMGQVFKARDTRLERFVAIIWMLEGFR